MTIRGRRSYVLSRPGFVVDHDSVMLNSGRQIDWGALGTTDFGAAGERAIPAGTVVAETEDGLLIPRAAATGEETAVGILVTGASERSRTDSLTGYGVYVGGVFYANLLPDFEDTDWATFATELGDRFVFEEYQDIRGGE